MSFSMGMMMKPFAPIIPSGGNIWAINYGGDVMQINNSSFISTSYNGVIMTNPQAMAFDGTNMWTADFSSGRVSKISPSGLVTSISLGGTPYSCQGIAFDGTHMWVTRGGNQITKINVTTLAISNYSGLGANARGIAFDGTNMWTANSFDNSVSKITPSGVITNYSGTGLTPESIAFDGTNMWTINSGDGTRSKISPSGVITNFPFSLGIATGNQGNIAFDGTHMWVLHSAGMFGTTFSLFDSSGTLYTNYTVSYECQGLAFDGTHMWTGGGSITFTKISLSGISTGYVIGINTPGHPCFDGCLLSHWWGGS